MTIALSIQPESTAAVTSARCVAAPAEGAASSDYREGFLAVLEAVSSVLPTEGPVVAVAEDIVGTGSGPSPGVNRGDPSIAPVDAGAEMPGNLCCALPAPLVQPSEATDATGCASGGASGVVESASGVDGIGKVAEAPGPAVQMAAARSNVVETTVQVTSGVDGELKPQETQGERWLGAPTKALEGQDAKSAEALQKSGDFASVQESEGAWAKQGSSSGSAFSDHQRPASPPGLGSATLEEGGGTDGPRLTRGMEPSAEVVTEPTPPLGAYRRGSTAATPSTAEGVSVDNGAKNGGQQAPIRHEMVPQGQPWQVLAGESAPVDAEPTPHGLREAGFKPGEVISQIVRHAELLKLGERTEVRMQLEPPSLGRVALRLSSENNKVSIQVWTETAEARDLVQANLSQLHSALQDQGVRVDRLAAHLGSTWLGLEGEAWGQRPDGDHVKPMQTEDSSEGDREVDRPGAISRRGDGERHLIDYLA